MIQESLVRQHNLLIEARGKMTLLEQKILRAIVAEIKPTDKDFAEYQLDVKSFKELAGLKRENLYEQIKGAAKRLLSRIIEVEELDSKGGTKYWATTFIISPEYHNGVLRVSIDPKLKPYLLELGKNYTRYQLKNVMRMKSTYSLRLYELLKQHEFKGQRKFSLDELKEYLGVESDYERFYDLEKRVLKPSADEINQLTDIVISYKKIKEARTIVAVEYTIGARDKLLETEKEKDDLTDIMQRSGLNAEPLSLKQVQNLYSIAVNMTSEYSLDPCDYIKIHTLMLQEQQGIKNRSAWLKKALQEDFLNYLPKPQQISMSEAITDDERYTEILKIYEKRKQAIS